MIPYEESASELQRLRSNPSNQEESRIEEGESVESYTHLRASTEPPPPIPFCFNVYDIIDLSTLLILLGAILSLKSKRAFERPFDPTDKDLQHDIAPNIVSDPLLFFIAIGIPIISSCLVRLTYVMLAWPSQRSRLAQEYVLEIWAFIAGLLFACAITGLFTETTKLWVGRLRPDFASRCQYSEKLQSCTNPDLSVIEKGRRSFPSGHSSLAFTGSVFLSLWLASLRIQSLRNEDPHRSMSMRSGTLITKYTISSLPLLLAVWVAATRVQQNIHHPTDVIAGAVLGTFFASISYFLYFKKKIEYSEWV